MLATGMDATLNENIIIPVTAFSSSAFQDVVSFSYTPKSTSSRLLIRFDDSYYIPGSNGDTFYAQMQVDNIIISTRTQVFADAPGGGTRSNVILPVSGIVKNEALIPRSISIQLRRDGDDTITVSDTNWTIEILELQT